MAVTDVLGADTGNTGADTGKMRGFPHNCVADGVHGLAREGVCGENSTMAEEVNV